MDYELWMKRIMNYRNGRVMIAFTAFNIVHDLPTSTAPVSAGIF